MEKKKASFGQSYYDRDYFEADVTGGKEYRHVNGSTAKWGYYAKQKWMGWPGILGPLRLLFRPDKILDVGCGAGSFVEMARINHLKAWGIDFSEWAIENALPDAKKWISVGDARDIPYPDASFDFLFASDLMEHIYNFPVFCPPLNDVDRVIDELCRVSDKWIFLQIATVGMRDKPSEGYFLMPGQEIPLELEGYAVSGHVTVQKPEWWREKLVRQGWRHRDDMVEKFRRLVKPPELIAFWRTVFVLEKWG